MYTRSQRMHRSYRSAPPPPPPPPPALRACCSPSTPYLAWGRMGCARCQQGIAKRTAKHMLSAAPLKMA